MDEPSKGSATCIPSAHWGKGGGLAGVLSGHPRAGAPRWPRAHITNGRSCHMSQAPASYSKGLVLALFGMIYAGASLCEVLVAEGPGVGCCVVETR
jgi:hypothetical protein